MKRLEFHRVAAVLLCFAILSGSALAEDQKPASSERAARQLLEDVEAAYKAMPGYADQGEWRVENINGVISGRLRTMFDRPSRLTLESDSCRFVSDGTTLTTVRENGEEYKTAVAPEAIDLRVFKDNDEFNTNFCDERTAPPIFAILSFLTEHDGVDVFLSHWGAKQLILEDDRTIDGVRLKVILVKNTRSYDFRLFIEEKSKRLVRMEVTDHPPGKSNRRFRDGPDDPVEVAVPAPVPDSPENALRKLVEARPWVLVWTAGAITDQRPVATAFVYAPPEGFRQAKLFGAKQRDVDFRPVERLVGKSAADFTLTMRDGPGGNSRLTKSDLRGKVVLLHFWSAKNISARESLQWLPEAIGGKRDGLVVVSICQDDTLQDLSDFRKLRSMPQKGNRPRLPKAFLRLNAIDPMKTIGDAFLVEALPTVVIIDARGVVQYVLVGYNHQWTLFVKSALEQLLAGETLLDSPATDVIVP